MIRIDPYTFHAHIERSADANLADGTRHIYHLAAHLLFGNGLDIGATQFGQKLGFPGALPVDNEPGRNAYDLSAWGDGSFDYIFSSHTLEHLEHPLKALYEWRRVLKHGATLFLYLPWENHPHWDPRIGGEAVRNEHKWQPRPADVARMIMIAGFQPTYVEYQKDDLWSFVVIGKAGSG